MTEKFLCVFSQQWLELNNDFATKVILKKSKTFSHFFLTAEVESCTNFKTPGNVRGD